MKKVILSIFCFFILKNSAIALVEVDITRGNLDPLPIAVSPLYIEPGSSEITEDGKTLRDVGEEISKVIEVNFRRVENVGPKVSDELINSAIIAITLSMLAMLIYIWIRFEWQFSIAAIVALLHDVLITLGIFSFLFYIFEKIFGKKNI